MRIDETFRDGLAIIELSTCPEFPNQPSWGIYQPGTACNPFGGPGLIPCRDEVLVDGESLVFGDYDAATRCLSVLNRKGGKQ
tara:strand:- start:101 stop:346 length:246 start_codon:yes stop_codon:yes gene_type:complete